MSTQLNTSTFWKALPRCTQSSDLHRTLSAHARFICWELLTSGLALFPFRCVFHSRCSHKQLFFVKSNSESAHSAKQPEEWIPNFSLDHVETREMRLRKRDFWHFSFLLLSIKDKKENKPEASQPRIFFLFQLRSSAHSWSYHYTQDREHLIPIFFCNDLILCKENPKKDFCLDDF